MIKLKNCSLVAVMALVPFCLTACEDGAAGAQGPVGESGENGTSCIAKKLKDGSGFELSCDDKVVGTIKNGENGEPGEPGEPGENGTNCTVADTTDETDNTKTGYKLLCGGTLKGVVWNGEKGQKGEGFSWRKNDGYMVTIDGNPYGWSYWTDRAEGGSSGFNWGQVPGIVTSGTDGAFTAEIVEEVEGVGGQVLLKGAYYNTKLDLNKVNSETSVQFSCWWDDCKINTEKMLGLCLEYISEFDNTELRIAYTGEQANGYARPYYKLPKTSTKKIINVPWAAFEKSPNWGATNVDVASAIKSTAGVGIHVMSYEDASGNLLITKLGAYGTCE